MEHSKDDVIRAIRNADDATLMASGWLFFFERVRSLYPRKNWPAAEQEAYVDVLEHSRTAIAGLNSWMLGERAQYKPSPMDLAVLMRGEQEKPPPERPGRGPVSDRLDNTPRAYMNVRSLGASGERVCECRPRTVNWKISESTGVLRCSECNGLEIGQVEQAEEAVKF